MRPRTIHALRTRALGLAAATVGLTAVAAVAFPGEASRLAPLALILPFVTMGLLERLAEESGHAH